MMSKLLAIGGAIIVEQFLNGEQRYADNKEFMNILQQEIEGMGNHYYSYVLINILIIIARSITVLVVKCCQRDQQKELDWKWKELKKIII